MKNCSHLNIPYILFGLPTKNLSIFPKKFRACEIFNNIENKLKNNEKVTDEDIASLQVIVYTDFDESKYEVLVKARKLVDKIAEAAEMDLNDKRAITYLLDMLSANMLDDEEFNQYMGESKMLINPRDRYFKNQGIEEGIKEGIEEGLQEGIQNGKLEVVKNMLKDGVSIKDIVKYTGLSEEDILNAK